MFLVPTVGLGVPIQQSEPIQIRGTITSENGPVAGATVCLFRKQVVGSVLTNGEGEFQIELDSPRRVKVLVTADGKFSQLHTLNPRMATRAEYQLSDVTSPLAGRIIDHQGMGVTDAKLRILAMRQRGELIEIPPDLDLRHFSATVKPSGEFQFEGIDRKTVRWLSISGSGIVDSTLDGDAFEDQIISIVQPARALTGKVIDRISKQPISNVRVSAGNQQSTTDASGEFKLEGLPAFQPLQLMATPRGTRPYLLRSQSVPVEQGFNPINVQVEMDPGLWISSRVKDFGTGGPASAQLFYFPTPENEDFRTFVDSVLTRGPPTPIPTDSSGVAKIVGIPGPGVVAIVAEGFPPNESVNKLSDEQRGMILQITGGSLTAVEWVDPKDFRASLEIDFLVSKGRSIKIEVAAPTKMLDSMIVHRAASKNSYSQNVVGNEFTAEQFQPGETRQILVHAPQLELGAVLNIEAESESPVKVDLEPTGSVGGQVVDENEVPQPGLLVKFEVATEKGHREIASRVFTDANGRFENLSLISNLDYRVTVVRLSKNQRMMSVVPEMDSSWCVAEDLKINPGEAVDLGSVQLGASDHPDPLRTSIRKKNEVVSDETLPPVIGGVVTNESGQPISDAVVSLNTWPERSGDLKKDAELRPKVLAQARSDSNGRFQITIDPSLGQQLVASDGNGNRNAAIVVYAEKQGTAQIRLSDCNNPRDLKIQMVREMLVRGKVSGLDAGENFKLITGDRIHVYDSDTIKQIVSELQGGKSLTEVARSCKPVVLDPLAGGLPIQWETSSSGVFMVRNIPFNAIFDLHVVLESGRRKTITVISRPLPGFEFKPTDDSSVKQSMQGSRIRLDLTEQVEGT
jgi:hypothetical protein